MLFELSNLEKLIEREREFQKKYLEHISDADKKTLQGAIEELEVFKGAKDVIDRLQKELQAKEEALSLQIGTSHTLFIPDDQSKQLLEQCEMAYRLWKRHYPNDITLDRFIEMTRRLLCAPGLYS